MIRRHQRDLIAECDGCGTEYQDDGSDFGEFIAILKEQGWLIWKDEEGQFTHYCPDCAEEC